MSLNFQLLDLHLDLTDSLQSQIEKTMSTTENVQGSGSSGAQGGKQGGGRDRREWRKNKPYCRDCNIHHYGNCIPLCENCGVGHTRRCNHPCRHCEDKGHPIQECPQRPQPTAPLGAAPVPSASAPSQTWSNNPSPAYPSAIHFSPGMTGVQVIQHIYYGAGPQTIAPQPAAPVQAVKPMPASLDKPKDKGQRKVLQMSQTPKRVTPAANEGKKGKKGKGKGKAAAKGNSKSFATTAANAQRTELGITPMDVDTPEEQSTQNQGQGESSKYLHCCVFA